MSRVDHLSYSAIMTFLRNQVEFQKRYIAKVWDNAKSPSTVVGSAFHKAMEDYYEGKDMQESISAGLEMINMTSDYEIDYGKTGSRERMIQDYTRLVNKYFEECPVYDVVDVEKRFEDTVHSVPMVGIADLVIKDGDGLRVVDHKTVSSYSPEDEENYKYLLQGYIYLILAEKHYKDTIVGVTFNEIKKSINRDGSPQRREVSYDRDSLLAFAPVAQRIITNVFSYVNDDNAKFFPNPSDQMNGTASMDLVSNMEEGFEASRVKKKVHVADKFAPRNVTIDVDESNGSNEELILRKFTEFGIGGITGETFTGASVIRYTFKPNRGISMNSIAKRRDDLAIALKSKSVRIEAPIPGTNLVGIEVPNESRRMIPLTDEHLKPGTMEIPVGEDIFGKVHYADVSKMPHLLIAGQTGSGKSVMLNVILKTLTKQLSSRKMKLVLIDPKQVELSLYEDKPHVLGGVVTEPEAASDTLNTLVATMESRYKELRKAQVRSIDEYKGHMPRIVVVVDEFADLMITENSKSLSSLDLDVLKEHIDWALESSRGRLTKTRLKKVIEATVKESSTPSCEQSIVRLAQKARAVGIHLILATQRPSADVVTGLIKANIPTKIAFSVTTAMNSKIILDQTGAEQLTGYGDMLYQDPRSKSVDRLQGLYC